MGGRAEEAKPPKSSKNNVCAGMKLACGSSERSIGRFIHIIFATRCAIYVRRNAKSKSSVNKIRTHIYYSLLSASQHPKVLRLSRRAAAKVYI